MPFMLPVSARKHARPLHKGLRPLLYIFTSLASAAGQGFDSHAALAEAGAHYARLLLEFAC
ncbi:hypothetical protein AA042_20120 [Pseudomonas lundensis]|nr:hypothetical protein AA042_20120 [Pseudomonas lundensis]